MPDHDKHACEACETHETVYAIRLSVVVTLTGKPGCHTPRVLLENAAAWLNTVVESGDDGTTTIDGYDVLDVREEK